MSMEIPSVKEIEVAIGKAITAGSILPLPTRFENLGLDPLNIYIRICDSILKRENPKTHRPKDPFAVPEELLFLCEFGKNYFLLLNKYNVFDLHVLITSKDFEHQTEVLSVEDFQAFGHIVEKTNGVCFYNSGAKSGASQEHKHLQVVIPPLFPVGTHFEEDVFPLEIYLNSLDMGHMIPITFEEPFSFIAARFKDEGSKDASAEDLHDLYMRMLALGDCNVVAQDSKFVYPDHAPRKAKMVDIVDRSYNMISMKRHIVLVVRCKSGCSVGELLDSGEDSSSGYISVNALGFAGTLLAKSEEARHALLRFGVMKFLKSLAGCKT